MKHSLFVLCLFTSALCFSQNKFSINQFWLGVNAGFLQAKDLGTQRSAYSYTYGQHYRQATFEYRREKRNLFFSGQLGFRSTRVDLYKKVYTHEYNDGDYKNYEGHYWDYESEVFSGSLHTDLNFRLPGDFRFQALFGLGAGVEKTLFEKVKRDDYIVFDDSGGHYYDPSTGQQVYYSHSNDLVYSTREKLAMPKSITSLSFRYFMRFQYRISPNQYIGADFRVTIFPKSLIGNLEGIVVNKGFDAGISWGIGLNSKK